MDNPFHSKLFLRSFLGTTLALVVMFVAMFLFSVPFIQQTVEGIEESHARTALNAAYHAVENLHRDMEQERVAAVLARKRSLQDITSVVASRASGLEQQVRLGRLGATQARNQLLEEIRAIHYGNNDYVWAANYQSVLVAHPDPALNGADFSAKRDTRQNLIVPPMVAGGLASGDGYYSYWWRRLGQEQAVEKLSYFKHIPFFSLVIGTGVYIDDIDATLSRRLTDAIDELRGQLRKTHLARTGYVYIFDRSYKTIIHPNATLEGKSLAGMMDTRTNQELLPMLIAAADKAEGVRYRWDRPADPGNFTYEKISWMRHFPGFDWYIGSSVYVDELQESAQILMKRMLVIFAMTLLIAVGMVYLFVSRLVTPLKQLSATARSIQQGDLTARCTVSRDDEIGVVTTTFNGMIDRLQENIDGLDARVLQRTAERERADEERREAETKLVESEGYNKMLFQESRLAMAVMDASGACIDCNPAAVEIYGLGSREDVLGKTPLHVSAPTQYDGTDSITAAREHLRIAQANGSDIFGWRYQRPDGQVWDGLVYLMSFHYHGQTLFQFTLEDITEKIRAEEARRQVDQLKSDFLSTVSHELRTPMTSVVGFAKLIKKKLDEVIVPSLPADEKVLRTASQVSSNIDIIVEESERLTLLINDVLDSAKLDAGKVEWNFVPLTAATLLERAATVTAELPAQKGLTLSWRAATDLPGISGDENRLLQVLINLISNAVKFTEVGEIVLHAEFKSGFVRFGVTDNGIGIAAEDCLTIFEKFRQIGDTLTDKPHGSGLGLSICRQIIEHHHGEIWVESAAGKGSTFFFTLPAHSSDTAQRLTEGAG